MANMAQSWGDAMDMINDRLREMLPGRSTEADAEPGQPEEVLLFKGRVRERSDG